VRCGDDHRTLRRLGLALIVTTIRGTRRGRVVPFVLVDLTKVVWPAAIGSVLAAASVASCSTMRADEAAEAIGWTSPSSRAVSWGDPERLVLVGSCRHYDSVQLATLIAGFGLSTLIIGRVLMK